MLDTIRPERLDLNDPGPHAHLEWDQYWTFRKVKPEYRTETTAWWRTCPGDRRCLYARGTFRPKR